jgi:phenylacetyl-CoA:acceptor oxidoreductase 27-kDa subunit
MTNQKLNRRDFLKLSAIGAAVVGGLKVVKYVSASGSPSGAHQWAMVIDQGKCTGCDYCTQACRAHNDVPPTIAWNVVTQSGQVGEKPVFIARPCMQCEKAPCVDVCPVQASTYRPDGIVMMDYERCIGCRYCEVACPYSARSFNWETFSGPNPAVPEWGEPEVARRPRGVVEKCSFCYNRIDRGLALGLTPGVDPEATPACVNICPTGARIFGDIKDPESNVCKTLRAHPSFKLRDDLATFPRVHYLPAGEEA